MLKTTLVHTGVRVRVRVRLGLGLGLGLGFSFHVVYSSDFTSNSSPLQPPIWTHGNE